MLTSRRKRPEPGTSEWVEYWAATIANAQKQTTVDIEGKQYARIRYGADYPDGKDQCRDCGVEHGQVHVPGCCVEVCPGCKGQAFVCDCRDESAVLH